MNICIVNKSDHQGGAAVATMRLHNALLSDGIASTVLVADKKTEFDDVIKADWTKTAKSKLFLRFAAERLLFLPNEKNKTARFAFSPANTGMEIHDHPLIQKSDIIHLHWFNQGFLSLNSLDKLLQSGKPIVWTLHDMWAFTGGCHYTEHCRAFEYNCGNCPFLRIPRENDLSRKLFQKKQQIFKHAKNLTFVTCSNWLKTEAEKSSLLKGFNIQAIPNPIHTGVFEARDKQKSKKKIGIDPNKPMLLFGAANIFDKRKGVSYLIDALKQIKLDGHYKDNELNVVLFGKADQSLRDNVGFTIHNFQYIDSLEKIVDLYNAADVFVIPSLQDNLPNTLMEALACGTPSVGFKTGGITEMIDHKQNGYIAELENAKDLAKGIIWVLKHENPAMLNNAARKKAETEYAYDVVVPQFNALYESLVK